MAHSSDRYRAVAPGDYALHPLDDLFALYDRRSGLTHLVLSPVPEMIDAMGAADWTLSELTTRLARDFALTADGDIASVIADRLAELTALGLVERVV